MRSSSVVIVLSVEERRRLRRWCLPSAQYRQRQRALIVLDAARGSCNEAIGRRVGVSRETVRKWRGRYAGGGLGALGDRPRSGRPRRFTTAQIAAVKAIACTSPDHDKHLPLARWSVREVTRQAIAEGAVAHVARSTVARWLAADALKPWQTRSWITPRDPDFALKAGVVLDLYQHTWHGTSLGPHDYVISADEKPGIQALKRARCAKPLLPARSGRVEFDYTRRGTLAYLAALDVHHGTVTGITDPTTGISPFTRLVETVMNGEPYASAHRVFWIVDNGSSHRGAQAHMRLQSRWPNTIMIHTPVHASWLNQIEIFFSILSRKALAGQSFDNTDQLATRIIAFQNWYNTSSQPFNWTWNRHELNDYLKRLTA